MSRINIPEVMISEENIAFYVIDICSGKEEESVPVRVLKRFSSLHRLHERLVSSNLICSVPFPSKTAFYADNTDPKLLETRREELELYLKACASDQDISNSAIFISTLQTSDSATNPIV
eukprot:g6112.t1